MGKTVVAVIDGGGRGAALIDAYAKSEKVDELIAIPGNDLYQINTKKPVHIFKNLKTTSKEEILKICQKFQVTLIDVNQDAAVEVGNANLLREHGFKVVGPSREAGQIEWDKTFSREILKAIGAPQPVHKAFDNEQEGIEFISSQKDKRWYIKAYGLAEGKGALPADNNQHAIERIKELKKFGEGGTRYLVEDWLVGEEYSAYALCDGENFQMVGYAQDHKRVFDGDKGENTGGMGCSTPPLVVTQDIKTQTEKILSETLQELVKRDRPYNGIVYFGGMVVGGKVYVIEYNARWGDPEVECILPGIQNDWFEVSLACSHGELQEIKTDDKSRIVVTAASKGYPDDYSEVKGREIKGLDKLIKKPGIKVYGAGVKVEDHKYLANGGRLFHLVADGKNVIEAREKAYKALELVKIEGENGKNLLHYRTDIGNRDVQRLKNLVK